MSHNHEPPKAARRHPGPIIGIAVALLVAIGAMIWWMGAEPAQEGDVTRIEAQDTPPPSPQPEGNGSVPVEN